MVVSSYPWKIGSLPFVYKPLSEPTNGEDIPDVLPFSLDIDKNTGTLIQSKNEYVEQILSRAYSKGSEISGMMDDHGIGEQYALDFLRFLTEQLQRDVFEGLKILEIGCGTGYLLSLLKQRGAEVLGIEPGDQGQEGARRFHIPVVQDFFPSTKISGKFDVVIMYAFLEHMETPVQILKSVSDYLTPNGIIVISVPNCEPYIQSGDISFILHEHWCYFSPDTLKNTIVQASQSLLNLKRSPFADIIYAVSTPASDFVKPIPVLLQDQIEIAESFKIKFQKSFKNLKNFLESAAAAKNTLGVYVPGRLINVLSLLIRQNNLPHLRFFDDNPSLYQTYYPGINIGIENRYDLILNPPDIIIIFSHSFGEKIKDEIVRSGIDSKVLLWEDISIDCINL